jgi:diguanylate cyclase (GGDEF)-like protein
VRLKITRWLGLLLWFCAAGTVLAQDPAATAAPPTPPIALAATQAVVPLDGRSRYWIDTSAQKTLDEVEAAGESLPWMQRGAGQQLRIDDKALWIQFDALSQGGGRWYLQITSAGLDRAQLFYRNGAGRWIAQEAGHTRPVSQWPLPGRVPTFELSEATSPVRYLLRIENERVDFAAPMALYSQSALLASRQREQFLLGAYFGLAALIAVVAAANAFAFRDRNFAAYAVYVLALGAGQVAYLGVGAQHLWDPWLKWNELAAFLLPGVSAAATLWFVKVVTEPARFSRALDLAVWSLIAAVLSAVALDAFLASRASFALVMALTAMGLVVVVILIALVWAQGEDPYIRLIALGFLPVLVMSVFPLARGVSLIPSSIFTRYGLLIGAAIEMPILFHALSLRASRRREAEVRAAALGHSDALTGLTDRRTLLQRLDSALTRARQQKHACALMAVRLCNHDAIATEFGAEIAARALVVTASALRHAISDTDLAARVGDHDFALLLEGPVTTDILISRAQQVVAKGLQQSSALPPTVTLKFHVAVALLPEKNLDAAETLRWAQDAVNAMRADLKRAIRPLNF